MAKYIEQELFKERLRRWAVDCELASDHKAADCFKDVMNLIEIFAEADVAKVVRCEDCKFASEEGGYEYLEQINTHVNCTKWLTRNHARSIMPKDGFCSEGKRRSKK